MSNKKTMPTDKGFNFPAKLHEILSRKDISDIISWCPHGRAWKVFKPRVFEEKIIPHYFRHSKYNSFTRQVNGWGFKRITQGPDQNSYYHELFLRGAPTLCKRMTRLKVGTKSKSQTSTSNPDFYCMHKIEPLPDPEQGNSSSSIGVIPGSNLQNPRADFNRLNKKPEMFGNSVPGPGGNMPYLMNQFQSLMNPPGNGNFPQDTGSSQHFIQAQYLNAVNNMNSPYSALGNNAHFQLQGDNSKNSIEQQIIAQQALISSLQFSNRYNQSNFEDSIAFTPAIGSIDQNMASNTRAGVPSIQFQDG